MLVNKKRADMQPNNYNMFDTEVKLSYQMEHLQLLLPLKST